MIVHNICYYLRLEIFSCPYLLRTFHPHAGCKFGCGMCRLPYTTSLELLKLETLRGSILVHKEDISK